MSSRTRRAMSCANWLPKSRMATVPVGWSAPPVGLVLPVAIRGGRVERDLEIRLDLGVVGCQDPMARVGERAVHGLAAALCGWSASPIGPSVVARPCLPDGPVYPATGARAGDVPAASPMRTMPGLRHERADGEARVTFAGDGAEHVRVRLDAAGLGPGGHDAASDALADVQHGLAQVDRPRPPGRPRPRRRAARWTGTGAGPRRPAWSSRPARPGSMTSRGRHPGPR